MYSTDFLSRIFCDKSRNCNFFAWATLLDQTSEYRVYSTSHTLHKYAPMRRKALGFSLLFDATERKVSVPGIVRECSIGFRVYGHGHKHGIRRLRCERTWSSRSHSLNTSLRRPHSMVKTSDNTEAVPMVSCTPEKSTVRGCVPFACYAR